MSYQPLDPILKEAFVENRREKKPDGFINQSQDTFQTLRVYKSN